jgi:hypothetical protein
VTFADRPGRQQPPRLVRVRQQLLVLAPVRVGLGLAGVAAALAAGVEPRVAVLAFGVAAFGSLIVLLTDRRALLLRAQQEAAEVPEGAAAASPWEAVRIGIFPSTVGVTALAVVALAFNAVLTAFLAGILAGMGLAGLVGWVRLAGREQEEGVTFYSGSRGGALYVRRGPRA